MQSLPLASIVSSPISLSYPPTLPFLPSPALVICSESVWRNVKAKIWQTESPWSSTCSATNILRSLLWASCSTNLKSPVTEGRGALKRRFPTNYKVFSENPPKWNCLSSMHFTASYLLFQIHPSISVPFITCAFLILFSIKLTDVSSHVLVNTRWCKLAYLTVWKQTNVIQHLEILVPSYQGSSTGGLRQYCKGSANYFLHKNVF